MVGDSSAMASSLTPSLGTQWKPKFPLDGWGSSLEIAALFTRAEIDRHIGKSGKHIGGDKHAYHSVPAGFKMAKTYLADENLHDIQTNFDSILAVFLLSLQMLSSVALKGTKALTI